MADRLEIHPGEKFRYTYSGTALTLEASLAGWLDGWHHLS